MKVLMAAAEGVPFAKTGGLADVIGSLPQALKEQDVDVRVMMPKYGEIPDEFTEQMEYMKDFPVQVGWRSQYCGVEVLEYEGITFYFLDNEFYFRRPGLYGHGDDGERFSFFGRAVLESLPKINFQADVIHAHDWHAGMIPVFLTQYRRYEFYEDMRTVFTIHNIQHQGVFPKVIMRELLGLGWEHFHVDGVEFFDQVNFMKGALNYADMLTTVSPTYAEEIQDPFFGWNLDGILRKRSDDLRGILNGLDYSVWDPAKDPLIYAPYSAEDPANKKVNKEQLQEDLNLPQEDVPVMGMVTRLAGQKGLDLIARVLPDILQLDLQFVVLGTGEKQFEDMFKHYGYHFPEKLSPQIQFDNTVAHRIYAGSDLFLMPSLFEPCGLGQLIALRYGSVPIVRETGGLKDTVQPYNEYTHEGNGFSFTNYNAHDMLYTIERAVRLYGDDEAWSAMMHRCMTADYSWRASARSYVELYEEVMEKS